MSYYRGEKSAATAYVELDRSLRELDNLRKELYTSKGENVKLVQRLLEMNRYLTRIVEANTQLIDSLEL